MKRFATTGRESVCPAGRLSFGKLKWARQKQEGEPGPLAQRRDASPNSSASAERRRGSAAPSLHTSPLRAPRHHHHRHYTSLLPPVHIGVAVAREDIWEGTDIVVCLRAHCRAGLRHRIGSQGGCDRRLPGGADLISGVRDQHTRHALAPSNCPSSPYHGSDNDVHRTRHTRPQAWSSATTTASRGGNPFLLHHSPHNSTPTGLRN